MGDGGVCASVAVMLAFPAKCNFKCVQFHTHCHAGPEDRRAHHFPVLQTMVASGSAKLCCKAQSTFSFSGLRQSYSSLSNWRLFLLLPAEKIIHETGDNSAQI